jgi:hypothetical protein
VHATQKEEEEKKKEKLCCLVFPGIQQQPCAAIELLLSILHNTHTHGVEGEEID